MSLTFNYPSVALVCVLLRSKVGDGSVGGKKRWLPSARADIKRLIRSSAFERRLIPGFYLPPEQSVLYRKTNLDFGANRKTKNPHYHKGNSVFVSHGTAKQKRQSEREADKQKEKQRG